MPLRDHFKPPFTTVGSWEEVHGGWPMAIIQQLGEVLPPRYTARPHVHLGTLAEVDVAAFETLGVESPSTQPDSTGVATIAWKATEPTLFVETELADFDEYEVRIYDASRQRRLVAAIELISPSNKDRAEHRWQFVSKCAALLRQRVCVVMIDVIGAKHGNLYAELLQLVGQQDPSLSDPPDDIYAVACRWRPSGQVDALEVWNHRLDIGQPLPPLPLWLDDQLAVLLDLEASYEQTLRDLRIA